ncbi:hypothetical protein HUG17_6542 [Dermatophagoides farinae]|uniref:C2H2-type domain-containing protein n=1 Tax=Dermatophagoides farinae TaxID=6954 RepID=A0A9D4P6Z7_DERFA|nr:hypothetical protein HUG17_6542 [Dermatophagoides farinae]
MLSLSFLTRWFHPIICENFRQQQTNGFTNKPITNENIHVDQIIESNVHGYSYQTKLNKIEKPKIVSDFDNFSEPIQPILSDILQKKFEEFENHLMSRTDKIECKVSECLKNVHSLTDDFNAHRQYLLDHLNLLKPIRKRRPFYRSQVWTIDPITETGTIPLSSTIEMTENPECSLAFTTEEYNPSNKDLNRKNMAKFSCTKCSYRFTSYGKLDKHLKTHKPENKHICFICGNRYKYQSSLYTHINTHTKERQFKCHKCSRVFSQKCNLIIHCRKHTGEKPYQCPYCNYKLRQYSNLVDHVKRKHPNLKQL